MSKLKDCNHSVHFILPRSESIDSAYNLRSRSVEKYFYLLIPRNVKQRELKMEKENVLATQAFANPENISEPQTGIEPATF